MTEKLSENGGVDAAVSGRENNDPRTPVADKAATVTTKTIDEVVAVVESPIMNSLLRRLELGGRPPSLPSQLEMLRNDSFFLTSYGDSSGDTGTLHHALDPTTTRSKNR